MDLLFHERSKIGHYSGNPRDFANEYKQTEPEDHPNDAAEWMEKAKDPQIQQKWEQDWQNHLKNPNRWWSKDAIFYYSGNSHIDLSWLWRYLQTVEKCRVTLSKACFHIDHIPEFTYSQSQAQMFEWCRRRYPDLFAKLQAAVKTGRLELVGGAWCEPDCHIISGESWVRQRLYGQLYFKKYFGRYATIEWVPDSFGFPPTLPQILVKSNATRFMTGKLNSNDDTRFPFSTFWWQSPDGSRVLAECMIWGRDQHRLLSVGAQPSTPCFSYESVIFTEHPNFSQDQNPHIFSTYGAGDGGHGPTGEEAQHQVYLARKEYVKLAPAEMYFQAVENSVADRLPVWQDELYLETHQGTLFSHCLVKKMNRFNEWHLPALEMLSVLALLNQNKTEAFGYPSEIIDEAWQITLLNQFHDVLPGTCIPETYDDVYDLWLWQLDQYSKIQADAFRSILSQLSCEIPSNIQKYIPEGSKIRPILIFNPSSFSQKMRIEIPASMCQEFQPQSIFDDAGHGYPVQLVQRLECPKDSLYTLPDRFVSVLTLPPLAISSWYLIDKNEIFSLDSPLKSNDTENWIDISNEELKIRFDKTNGSIISLMISQKGEWKETLKQGKKKFDEKAVELEPGIKIQAFKEMAKHFPAWNMWKESRQNPFKSEVKSVKILTQTKYMISVQSVIEYWSIDPEVMNFDPNNPSSFNRSVITSDYNIYAGDPLLYITLHLDFNGKKTLLKLDIPTNTNADRIDAEVAYGYDNRSTIPKTPRDQARFENLMHTWVNIQSKSENWGIAIINDGKYGLDYHQGYLGISLIHGQSYFPPRTIAWVFEERFNRDDEKLGQPPGWIDQGQHIFRLAIYPHWGSLESADVIPKAHWFNCPPLIFNGFPIKRDNSQKFGTELRYSLPKASFPLEITTLKLAHSDGDAGGWNKNFLESSDRIKYLILILRVVNMSREAVTKSIDFTGLPLEDIHECDLLERPIENAFERVESNKMITQISANWKCFEIKTFALKLNKDS